MFSIREMSFKAKLLLYATSTTAAALALCCAAVLSAEWVKSKDELPRNLGIQADVIANNAVAALMFDDPSAAEESLKGLKADSNVIMASVLKLDGSEFARYTRPQEAKIVREEVETGKHRFSGGTLHLKRHMVMDDEVLGSIYVQYDLREFYGRLRTLVAILVVAMVAALGGALAVASRLQKVLTRPITELSKTSQGIGLHNDYSVRAHKYSHDELGTLTDAFNDMLARIEERDHELQMSRATLEQRVLSRTESLQRQERFQASLATLGRYVIQQTELNRSIHFALETISKTLDVPFCEVLRTLSDDDKLLFSAGVGWPADMANKVRLRVSENEQFGFTMGMDRTVVVEDALKESRFDVPVILKEVGVRASITTPIRDETGLFGVLGVHCKAARVFSEDEVCFLESVANVISEAQQRFHAAERLALANGQLEAVRAAMLRFISDVNLDACTDGLVVDLCSLTASEFGFIGEVCLDDAGQPSFQLLASNRQDSHIADQSTGVLPPFVGQMIERVLVTGDLLISNNRQAESRVQTPALGDQPISSLLLLPFSIGQEVNGMVGLVNRRGGYNAEFAETLKPVLVTCANLVHANRSEIRRRQAEIELEDARQRAEAASQAKSDFLANMSHEIRTPLTAIGGFAELLVEYSEGSQVPPECTEAAITIRRNGEHLLGIINDILDLSRVEAGKMVVERMPIDLRPFVDEVIGLMKLRAESDGLELGVSLASDLPETISTDPMRLRQILINLIGNSIKFTEIGEVRVEVRLQESDGEGVLAFDVVDTGIGMNEEQMARLFQPFTQADNSMTRRYGGTGLGLTISQRFAQMLGGDIWVVESQPGKGSRFRLSISAGLDQVACQPIEANGALPSSPGSVAADDVDLQGKRILLAEDGPDNQRLIMHILKMTGADVTVTSNGDAAIDAVAGAIRDEAPYDVILMDMQMPVMNGYEATKTLRDRGVVQPIIALTAHANEGDQAACLSVGCTEYLAKPIDRNRLLHLLARLASVSSP
ncbi:MAG: ATP-binding protein [Phycisphaerae bacterium]